MLESGFVSVWRLCLVRGVVLLLLLSWLSEGKGNVFRVSELVCCTGLVVVVVVAVVVLLR
ncbi:hypothetical protein T440DRAFT_466804 [Plenodomus tracheiphilus IPT5]|uniref:Uncharacterized protein n=1 Tax=Plenodomus tracheiphilus IPT5 TaxID=1408161 RepID=A0A6A7BBP4_9PLEO|nr:hypothetical protein T440DRAFT_466804 [Plenodomus tracheiphilus IPT5]